MPVILANSYSRLRQCLAPHLLDSTPRDIGLPLPVSLEDELSFYRLVVWGYALVQEVARVPLDFLTSLPPLRYADPPLREIKPLRTWMNHNINLASSRDRNTLRKAQVWLRQSCGTSSPMVGRHWGMCCNKLHSSMLDVLNGATAACDALNDETDGARLVEDLRRRVETTWEAFRFDTYIAGTAARLGFDGLSVAAFRAKHLDNFRAIVESSDGEARDSLLTQYIETQMTDLMADALPTGIKQLVKELCLSQPERIVAALIVLRETQKRQPEKLQEVVEQMCSQALQT